MPGGGTQAATATAPRGPTASASMRSSRAGRSGTSGLLLRRPSTPPHGVVRAAESFVGPDKHRVGVPATGTSPASARDAPALRGARGVKNGERPSAARPTRTIRLHCEFVSPLVPGKRPHACANALVAPMRMPMPSVLVPVLLPTSRPCRRKENGATCEEMFKNVCKLKCTKTESSHGSPTGNGPPYSTAS